MTMVHLGCTPAAVPQTNYIVMYNEQALSSGYILCGGLLAYIRIGPLAYDNKYICVLVILLPFKFTK